MLDGLKRVVVGEAADGATAAERIRTETWDVLVLDLTLPGASGLDLPEEDAARSTTLPVLV